MEVVLMVILPEDLSYGNGAINGSMGNDGNVVIGCNGINTVGINIYGSGSDSAGIILAPYVAGACGVGACVMVHFRLVVWPWSYGIRYISIYI